MVIAPLTVDTEETLTYGELQLVAGAIEASIAPQNTDPDIQYADDVEFDVLYPDPELTFTTKMADIPLSIQEMIFGNEIDEYSGSAFYAKSEEAPMTFAMMFATDDDWRPTYSTPIETTGID